ncbi:MULTISPECIES: nucleoside hydrolase [unclassified Dietzia]|uniref:nucleoside hydrolase n=2 Tax=Dietzia TaxID=37914 RepID=UPI000D200208|nr:MULTISPECIES: nucleoside hydrolase [unclassified Dietzia]AVZ39425.1 nucleoside hydrolase [Dietzia sp. JS16-p6b]MBB1026914.1 nucleoside hydrolase [Dietzia sp. DQ11-38-2]QGW24694.1 inosine/uridine-preferring nucleoside hydrolase [Dietzia sp. DQ12-45-1b]
MTSSPGGMDPGRTGRIPVLLDCDPGIDDALAIAYLVAEHRAGSIDLAGLVCTAGNVGIEDTVRNALAWLDLAGAPPVPVSAGAAGATVVPHAFTPETHGPRGAGHAGLPPSTRVPDPRSGARLWVDAARAAPGELVGIVTGPSSTIAHALELEPALPRLLRRLVVMGGSFRGHPGNTTPVSEWNVDVDPEAADRVCLAWEAARSVDPSVPPVRWCGLDLTERAVWTPEHSERLLAASGTPLARHLVDALRFYFEFHESVGEGYLAQVHDPLVAWLALRPGAALTEPVHLRVECAGEHTRGMTVEDRRGHRGRPANAELVVDLSVPGGAGAVVEEVAASIADLH